MRTLKVMPDETVVIPIQVPSQIPEEIVKEVLGDAAKIYKHMEETLIDKEDCLSFIDSALKDGVKLADDRYLDFEFQQLRLLCATVWFKKVEMMLNDEYQYVGDQEVVH